MHDRICNAIKVIGQRDNIPREVIRGIIDSQWGRIYQQYTSLPYSDSFVDAWRAAATPGPKLFMVKGTIQGGKF